QPFEIGIALRFLQPYRNDPAVLGGLNFFVIPIRAFDQTNSKTCPALASPRNQIMQIVFGVAQISLNDNAGMRPVAKLRLGEEGAKKFEGRIFVRVAFHVEIDESAELLRAAQNRAKLWREMRNCVSRIGRIHLRIERGNFYRHIYDWEQLGVLAERIGPAARFPGEMFE